MDRGDTCWLCNIRCACYTTCRSSCCGCSTGLGSLANREAHENLAVLCLGSPCQVGGAGYCKPELRAGTINMAANRIHLSCLSTICITASSPSSFWPDMCMLPLSGQIYWAFSYTSHAAGDPNACWQDGKRLWRSCSMPYSEGRPGTAACVMQQLPK